MGIEIPLAIHSKPHHPAQRAVYAAEHTVIPPRSVVCVPARVQTALPEGRDYVFEGRHRQAAFYSYLVEANFSRVQAVNDTGNPVTLRRRDRIGTLYEADMPMACAVESVQANRQDADECAKYAAMVMKKQYDTRHKPVFFEKGDYVYLCLAQGAEPGYVLPSRNITRKLTQRHIGCVG